jgi:hypothetical protein
MEVSPKEVPFLVSHLEGRRKPCVLRKTEGADGAKVLGQKLVWLIQGAAGRPLWLEQNEPGG